MRPRGRRQATLAAAAATTAQTARTKTTMRMTAPLASRRTRNCSSCILWRSSSVCSSAFVSVPVEQSSPCVCLHCELRRRLRRYFKFAPGLEEHLARARLVVSHAGAGSVFEALRLGKPLVVVVNDTLMDNHQQARERAAPELFVRVVTARRSVSCPAWP